MLMLSMLHSLLSQVLSPPHLHTAVLLTTAGELMSFASEPTRPKDEVRIIAGLCTEVWQETREQGYGMVDSELGRIIVLPVDEFAAGPEQVFSDEHQPLMLLALNATDAIEWEELQSKVRFLRASHMPVIGTHTASHEMSTPKTQSRPEPIPIEHDSPTTRQRPDPYIFVASELTHIRNNMLNLLGAAHPGLAGMAEYYFLHPSKQLRSLLVLLFARATNGLGRHWERKDWDAACESSSGHVLNEWNMSMQDDTASFESVFMLQRSIPRPDPPTPPSSSRLAHNISPRLVSPLLLPSQIRLAQIVEMIHVASQLHDAIVPTPEQDKHGFGNKLSILGGDFLLGRASTALSRLGEREVTELVSGVISNLVEGEFLRMEEIRTPELGLIEGPTTLPAAWELYLRKTYLKTASLMAKGARSAVILGGCQDGDIWKEAAYAYGRNLGIAYQHFKAGLVTGPALFASEENPRLLPMIQRNFTTPGDTELATEYIRATSGVERTRLLQRPTPAKPETRCASP
ncbi:isoprenoid synthase domain-containing protein [Flammula alnicola]|nr:isoprenoid synthase domain-containing protein [Flammula alnicola]